MEQNQRNDKLTIYQLLPRHFGNKVALNKLNGSVLENGTGKLNDISNVALQELKKMGFSHIWYTGVIEHATMTDFSAEGISIDDPDVVKGRAGSPYAVKDYYDINPDLAVDIRNRMAEFESLIKRTHDQGLQVIIDFIPNHVARTYSSDVRPAGVRDLGQDDDRNKAFDPSNDFYYLPGQPFHVPNGYEPGGHDFKSPLKDGRFDENPARVTGNEVFSAYPSMNDWFETMKLNYGLDYLNNRTGHFDPVPPLWYKLFDILYFWADKGVDGFRCDMVEMVPFEFWHWVISRLKNAFPALIFIGEAYNVSLYNPYIFTGNFDYLYDKVGLYDAIRKLTCNYPEASTWDINRVWNYDSHGINGHMLRFMENHDEQRIASRYFAGDPWLAIPGMVVSATLSTGPVMIYSGQEVGEPAVGEQGFSGDDGRTSIFDYCGVPEHQKWMNKGKFDGGGLSSGQRKLREFYSKLLNAVTHHEALRSGKFWELMLANERQPGFDQHIYIFLRYTDSQRILVVTSFSRNERQLQIKLSGDLLEMIGLTGKKDLTDLLSGKNFHTEDISHGVDIILPPMSGFLLEIL